MILLKTARVVLTVIVMDTPIQMNSGQNIVVEMFSRKMQHNGLILMVMDMGIILVTPCQTIV